MIRKVAGGDGVSSLAMKSCMAFCKPGSSSRKLRPVRTTHYHAQVGGLNSPQPRRGLQHPHRCTSFIHGRLDAALDTAQSQALVPPTLALYNKPPSP